MELFRKGLKIDYIHEQLGHPSSSAYTQEALVTLALLDLVLERISSKDILNQLSLVRNGSGQHHEYGDGFGVAKPTASQY